MMTNKEQRVACISLAMLLENLTDSFYIDVSTVYCDVTILCEKLMEMAKVNRFLNNQFPYELKKKFRWFYNEEGEKVYTLNLKVVDYKKFRWFYNEEGEKVYTLNLKVVDYKKK